MALPNPVARRNQKIIKPQFFAAYRAERENVGRLDTAAAYIVKKAVSASVKLAERSANRDGQHGEVHEAQAIGAWGGMPSSRVLATELVPMMIKIQGMSKGASAWRCQHCGTELIADPLLPISVKPLSMPSYESRMVGEELSVSDKLDEGDFVSDTAGEDGLGVVDSGGWDLGGDSEDQAESAEEEIEDWDE